MDLRAGALPLDELGAKLTLGYSMVLLRDKAAKSKGGLFQQARQPVWAVPDEHGAPVGAIEALPSTFNRPCRGSGCFRPTPTTGWRAC